MSGPACHRSLRRFWFPLSTGLGIGVTAASVEEAREFAEAERARSFPGAVITAEIADVDLSTLDQDHVLPNSGPVVVRGVWFPRRNL